MKALIYTIAGLAVACFALGMAVNGADESTVLCISVASAAISIRGLFILTGEIWR